MRKRSSIPALAAGAAVAASLACGAALAAPAASGQAPAKPDATAPAWQNAAGKHTGSGVAVRYAVPDKIAVGETVTVRLQLAGVSSPEGATVVVSDPASRATLLTLRLASGEQRTVELPYAGRSDGMQFLDVTTTQAGRMTVVSVPLRVGSGELKLKPEGQRRVTSGGEAVISLPASSPASGR